MSAIGFIGLGNMGAPMAARLAEMGHTPAVFDVAAQAVQAAVQRGALGCGSAREVGDQAEIVFCCLPRPEVSVEVARALQTSSKCRVIVEMSTVGRQALQRIAAAAGPGMALLDCPISGGVAKAASGQLSAIVAGPTPLVERVRPFLELLASRVFVVGEQPGQAQVCKIANNAISITGLVVACEAVVMGMKAGLDPALMIEVINASTGRNSATVDKFPKAILPGTFDYGGPLEIGTKDLQLYLDEARLEDTPGLAVSNVAQLWAQAERRYGPRADMTMIFRLLQEWAMPDEDKPRCP